MPVIEIKVKEPKLMPVAEFFKLRFNSLKQDKGRDISKLKNSIKLGWSIPVVIWADHDFVMDGTGRKVALKELLDEGYEITGVPYTEVIASTLEEAKHLALQISSVYGKITEKSLKTYTTDLKVNQEIINLEGIDTRIILDSDAEPSTTIDDPDYTKVIFVFTNEQAEVVHSALERIKKSKDYKELDKAGNKNRNGNALFLLVKGYLENND